MVKITPPGAKIREKDPVLYDYLYQLQEYLSLMTLNPGSGLGGVETGTAQVTSLGAGGSSGDFHSEYENLKALIIKTADLVEKHTQVDLSGLRQLIDELGDLVSTDYVKILDANRTYVAISDFGTYQEAVRQQLGVYGDSIEQQVKFLAELSDDYNTWRTESEGYIRSGIVAYRDDGYSTPIIGIAIGQNLTVRKTENGDVEVQQVTIDGVTHSFNIIEQKGFRAIYAADELSFWIGEKKVAYMSNNKLYITDVVALNSMRAGGWIIRDEGANGLVFKCVGG